MIPIVGDIGDINGDENVNGADTVLILRYRIGLLGLSSEKLYLADVNGDGLVNTIYPAVHCLAWQVRMTECKWEL